MLRQIANRFPHLPILKIHETFLTERNPLDVGFYRPVVPNGTRSCNFHSSLKKFAATLAHIESRFNVVLQRGKQYGKTIPGVKNGTCVSYSFFHNYNVSY
jgi:hypothetical protein